MLNAIRLDNRSRASLSVLMKCFTKERDYYIFIKRASALTRKLILLLLRESLYFTRNEKKEKQLGRATKTIGITAIKRQLNLVQSLRAKRPMAISETSVQKFQYESLT